MDNTRRQKLRDEERLVSKFITNIQNGQILQLSSSNFIDELFYIFSSVATTPISIDVKLDDDTPINILEFSVILQQMHPIEEYNGNVTLPPAHSCARECFLRTMGTMRGRENHYSNSTALQMLKSFIDPDRMVPMVFIYPMNTFPTRERDLRTFEMFYPPSHLGERIEPISLSKVNGLSISDPTIEGIHFDEVQIHFLSKTGKKRINTRHPFKVIVTKESIFTGSAYLLGRYLQIELSKEETTTVLFDVFRIFRRYAIVTSYELRKLLDEYLFMLEQRETSLQRREKDMFRLSIGIVKVLSRLAYEDESVFT